jgi:hypothetical protein
MRRLSAAGLIAPALAIALLAGCSTAVAEPEASTSPSSPSASATATAEPAVAPNCENLWTADFLARAEANGFALDTEWSGPPDDESLGFLVPFLENDGVICIWGSPDYLELPYIYAWSTIDAATSASVQADLAAAGAVRSETADGVVFRQESQTHENAPLGYLFREGDWFLTTNFADLEPMAARFDAL